MVEFLFPKLFTTFNIFLNAFIGGFLGYITCFLSAVFFTVNAIIFWVKSDLNLALILNIIAFVFTVLFLGIDYIALIFTKYVLIEEKYYEKSAYPPSFFDDLNFQTRMSFISLLTLLFVANFANMWIYKENYSKIQYDDIPIPNQPILS